MPIRRIHNKKCITARIKPKICDETNRHLDGPSQDFPGHRHREYRHSKKYCNDYAKKFKNTRTQEQVRKACEIHIRLDRKEEQQNKNK